VKLYIGSREFRPEGYQTVDIDPATQPDILADAAELTPIASDSVEEVCASAILEHIPWPRAYQALSEFARVLQPGGVLKISVPDMRLLCSMVARGARPYYAIGMMFGGYRTQNIHEAHQYGYTREMLHEILAVLGFGEFGNWSSSVADASNGWLWTDAEEKTALMINLSARKIGVPAVETRPLVEALAKDPLQSFMTVVRETAGQQTVPVPNPEVASVVFQRVQYELIDARERIRHLEREREQLLAGSEGSLEAARKRIAELEVDRQQLLSSSHAAHVAANARIEELERQDRGLDRQRQEALEQIGRLEAQLEEERKSAIEKLKSRIKILTGMNGKP
jgi:predicted SAM-dependent methyltransferase